MRRSPCLVLVLLLACQTNPYTHRSQLILLDEETELALGTQGFQEILAKESLSTDPAEYEPVERIGRAIAAVANRPDYRWEFVTIKNDKVVNAFALPGGKVAVYTGIFPVADNEAGLAMILGHEVMHALARHGAERISQGIAANLGSVLLGAALSGRKYEQYKEGALAAYGIAANLAVLLPFSRDHESEADRHGMILAAKAGYDPREAPEVWKRMKVMSGSSTPEFLSTHPSHETRIENLTALIPQAMSHYEKSRKQPSAKLPALGRRPGPPPARATVPAKAGRAFRTSLEDGTPAAQFEFVVLEDCYLEVIELDSPTGSLSIKAGTAISGNQAKLFTVTASRPPPKGIYKATLRGKRTGRPFATVLQYQLR